MIRIALLAVAIAAPSARADGGAIVVIGGAPAHARAVIAAAVEDTARRAAWSVAGPPREVATVVACLQAERPWPCLAPALAGSGAQQLIVVQAELDRAQVVLTGQLIVAGGGVPAIDRRYCAACDDDGLARAAEALARQLLRDSAGRAAATLEVRSVPPGAAITLDERAAGDTDRRIAATPGRHRLVVARGGFRTERRTVELAERATTVVALELSRTPARPALLPALAIAAGALAVAGGAYVSWTADAPLAGPQHRYRYDGVAIGVAIVGAGAIGAGIAWWWRRARSAPVVAVGATGAVAGWFIEL